MIREGKPQRVPHDAFFTAYSGSTVRNYKTGAYRAVDGSVVFDKRRNPRHDFRETFFLENLSGALEYAANLAFETSDMPVIMEGEVLTQYRRGRYLPAGIVFPVQSLWVVKEGIKRAELLANAVFFGDIGEAVNSIERIDPTLVLREHS